MLMTVDAIRRQNLETLVRELGSLESVAAAGDTSAVYLSQIRHGAIDSKTGRARQMGTAMARRLEVGTGRPKGWMDQHHPEVGERPPEYRVALDLSQSPGDAAQHIPWAPLMASQLPTNFKLTIPDDAMAPRVRSGETVEFCTSEQPRPGDGVLVADSTGAWHFRLYRVGAGGHWTAAAINTAYREMDSRTDGLVVVAVLVAVQARWG